MMIRISALIAVGCMMIGCAATTDIPAEPPSSTAVPLSTAPVPANLPLPPLPSTDLFADAVPAANVTPQAEPMIIRSRLVTLNIDLLAEAIAPPGSSSNKSKNVPLNLFPDAKFIAVPDRVDPNPKGFLWIGHLDGITKSQVTFVVENNIMSGNIRLPGKLFQVRYVGNGIHTVSEIDPKAYPPD